MYLYTCFFFNLYYCICSIKDRKSGGIIFPLKIECTFNNRGFFIFSLYPHNILRIIQYFELITKVFIYIGK